MSLNKRTQLLHENDLNLILYCFLNVTFRQISLLAQIVDALFNPIAFKFIYDHAKKDKEEEKERKVGVEVGG